MSDDLSRYLIAGAAALSIPVDHQVADQFIQYSYVLQEWNKRINLTAIEDPHAIIVKHFIDSMAPVGLGLVDSLCAVLDVGSGAGFPGIPLKIIRPQLSVMLLEPNKKKLSFLHYVVGLLRLTDMSIVGMTLQEFSNQSDRQFDIAATRAVNLTASMDPVHHVLKPTGTVLAYRSSRLAEPDIPNALTIRHEWTYELPFDYGSRVLSQLELTPAGSPSGMKTHA